MKRFNFLLTGILVVLLASCSQRTQITDSKPTVKIDTVLSAGGQTALQFPGRVKAAQDISLSFRVSGTILRMYVNDGTYVRKGQLLAELDPADYQIQLDAAEAEYQSVKAEAERVMALYKENVTTPDQYELLEMSRVSGFVDRAKGAGRPTKKDRRSMEEFTTPEFMDDFDFDFDFEEE